MDAIIKGQKLISQILIITKMDQEVPVLKIFQQKYWFPLPCVGWGVLVKVLDWLPFILAINTLILFSMMSGIQQQKRILSAIEIQVCYMLKICTLISNHIRFFINIDVSFLKAISISNNILEKLFLSHIQFNISL